MTLTLAGLGVASVFGASSALAATSTTQFDKASACGSQTIEQPFLPWIDPAQYVIVPGGNIETKLTGWSLSGGAKAVTGNETFMVGGTSHTKSLSLPSGSSVTTRPMCIGLEYPTLRFFARNTGDSASTLKAEVLFQSSNGDTVTLPFAYVKASGTWQPTLPLLFFANLTALRSPDLQTVVAFRFTPQGTAGTWRIDDLYVDPFRVR